MTPDERIEKLLNRAGQTISDLPKAYSLSTIEAKDIQETACQWLISEGAPEGVAIRNLVSIPLYQYILHLTDVIDRMETALENVCGERDYLLQIDRMESCCWTCTNSDSGPECHRPEGCVLNDEGRCVGYEYAGVPEDWRPEE